MPRPRRQGMVETRWLGSIKSEAVFAKRFIRRGTRIAAEIPLITIPPLPEQEHISAFCEEIYKSPKDTIYPISKLTHLPLAKERVNKDYNINDQVWKFFKTKKFTDNAGVALKGKRLHREVKKMVDLCIIFRTNSVQLGPEGAYGSGIFSLYSRMNHSCVPNAHNSYNPTLQRLTIHAIHDIKAGDQIFVDYIGNVCRTRQQRAFSLYNTWGITCDCVACTKPHLNQLRCRMLILDQALAAYECGASADPNFSTIHRIPRIVTTAGALKATEELVRLLKTQRLHGIELCRTLHECSKYALDSGATQKALRYAQDELELETILIGAQTNYLQQNRQGAKCWVKLVRERIQGSHH